MDILDQVLGANMATGKNRAGTNTTIRLADYSIADGTLNDVVVSGITTLGGVDHVLAGSDDRFWDDILEKKPDYVILMMGDAEVRVSVGAIITMPTNAGVDIFSISFSGHVFFNGVTIEVRVVIGNLEERQSTALKITGDAF